MTSANAMSLVVAVVVSGTFLWAGLEKLRSRSDFGATLTALGLPPAWRGAVIFAVPTAELLAGAGVLVFPSQIWPKLGVVGLGAAFAVAGVLGVRSDRPIACSCLGTAAGATLGLRQVLMLPVWTAAAVVLQWAPHSWSSRTGVQYLAAAILALGVIRGFVVTREWRRAAGDRRALQESASEVAPMFVTEGAAG